jgi:hypothetical protein
MNTREKKESGVSTPGPGLFRATYSQHAFQPAFQPELIWRTLRRTLPRLAARDQMLVAVDDDGWY